MERVLTKEEARIQLRGKSEALSRRLHALEGELSSTPQDVEGTARKNPWVAMGTAAVGGLILTGVLRRRRRKRRRREAGHAHRDLVEHYIESVADEARYLSRKKDTDAALREALEDRVPLVVYAPEGEAHRKAGLLRDLFDLVVKTSAAFAIKASIDYLTTRMDLDFEELERTLREQLEASASSENAVPVAAAVADSDDS